ncbi:ran guanine nucleotide release factor [Hemicordylus capensis]|uniref:ran guanine nucleotide release factor n=1 Tax=Hemicordylus capensis TaxID=884348 RepID=UPI002302608F|nr:ran guanine nucleotide release factor [Hemicordylus capensis]XP_053121700.1 ran guanine nucleotide release factor [Hemicordylus capensis]XP_053121702.1 ran guanine nucleotide release factor [Hemicordylus capensis]
MDNTVDQQQHPLFGGAFSALLPPGSLDVSELRQVPDNQEVFVHPSTDQSIIIELLEYQAGVADENAARYHFEDMAGPSANAEILSQEPLVPQLLALDGCSSAWCLTASQRVAKFNEEAKNEVNQHLALLRLPQYGTDLLLTFNNPIHIHPLSSSAARRTEVPPPPPSHAPWTVEHFHTFVRSLRLLDPGIFG